MKKQTGKLLAGIMAAAMTFSFMPANSFISVYAEETSKSSTAESEDLKKAIADVKSRISVPKELTEFKYTREEKYQTTFYTLYWYSKGSNYAYIANNSEKVGKYLKVTYFDGMITSYRYEKFNNGKLKRSFAKLTVSEQEEYAKKHLKTLNPDLKGNVEITRNSGETSLVSSNISYTISRSEYGVKMENNSGTISINRDTGELADFNLNWYNDAKPQDASKRISVEKANDIYKQRKGLSAHYEYYCNSEYDPQTKEWKEERFVLPVYVPEKSGENEIDAFTGEYTAYYSDREKYSHTDEYEWDTVEEEYDAACEDDAEAVYGSYFSDEELKAIDEESKYITKEKVTKILKDDPYIQFDDNLVFMTRNINKQKDSDGNDAVYLTTTYRYSSANGKSTSLSVKMDAATGEIISFSKNYTKEECEGAINDSSARKTANKAAAHFMGDKMKEYNFKDSIDTNTFYDKESDKNITLSKTYRYVRNVNSLDAPFDTVNIEVNANGEVTDFSYTYHNIDFPAPKLVGEAKAYEKLFEKMQPTLIYKGFRDLQMRPHLYLTYIYDSDFTINGLTGQRIDWRGKPYYTEKPAEEKAEIKYIDIKGHKYEKEINTLLAYNVYITSGNKLNPDEDITIGEFMELLNKGCGIYNIFSFRSEEERLEYYSHRLTYAELAKMFVCKYTNMANAAELEGIYKAPFGDVSEDSEYCGYIAIAKAKGFITGKNGKFSPDSGLTKAECFKLIYDYLSGDGSDNIYEIFKI